MSNVTRTLAEFSANLKFEDIPHEVVERAKLLVVDIAGIAVRARLDADSTPSLLAAMHAMDLSGGQCSVFGDRETFATPAAALINGALAHSLDFDDTHAPGGGLHPGAPVIPAVLAAGQQTGASGRDVLAAIVTGYEVGCRLAVALVTSDHVERGFHLTGTCGAFAAAAAVGRVLNLDASLIEHAFGLALSEAGGSMQYVENGAWSKRFQVGNAARNGVVAAYLAQAGFTGAAKSIEGKYGFFNSYAFGASPDMAVAGLGTVWETMATAVKPYPACRLVHASTDAALKLREEHGIDPNGIQSVVIGMSKKGIALTGAPEERKRNPQGAVDGQFSMHFAAAVALREGRLTWDDYPVHLTDADTFALMQKISVEQDADVEAEFPANMSGKTRIVTESGEVFEAFVKAPLGEPENFLTHEQTRSKFAGLVTPCLGEAGQDAFFNSVMQIETGSVSEVFEASLRSADPVAAGDD